MVTLHVPLTPETRHLVRQETLELMKPGAMLVNVSRGQLIDTAALIRALKSRHLGGVALDVYEEEEGIFFEDLSGQILEDDVLARLLTFPNVLITAHQAFLTREALDDIAGTTVENVRRLDRRRTVPGGDVILAGPPPWNRELPAAARPGVESDWAGLPTGQASEIPVRSHHTRTGPRAGAEAGAVIANPPRSRRGASRSTSGDNGA